MPPTHAQLVSASLKLCFGKRQTINHKIYTAVNLYFLKTGDLEYFMINSACFRFCLIFSQEEVHRCEWLLLCAFYIMKKGLRLKFTLQNSGERKIEWYLHKDVHAVLKLFFFSLSFLVHGKTQIAIVNYMFNNIFKF